MAVAFQASSGGFRVLLLTLSLLAATLPSHAAPRCVSGIYPHLAMFNEDPECGTGAVVPWADRLWVVTYSPHRPEGSADKLYEITPDLKQIVRPESIGGTPANRMIHRESSQLFIGPYAIDAQRRVRAIPYTTMFGRPTGNARHLIDPAGKIYYATMEEGFYEVDVQTLAVTELWADEQKKEGRKSELPGYHGKGLYSGQGRIVYANNGDHAAEARSNPAVPSGALAEWDGVSDRWNVIRRNQFTEVTGPGGIYGNTDPQKDPIWTIGWDHKSLILQVLDHGRWHSFRLPKGSHSYDGAHGWNTEWPRIREIGKETLLMTMHGTFWKFPRTFSSSRSAGVVPQSNYLKVIGDFCRWGDHVVFGCDDTAKSEFLNKRKAKGEIAGPGQSQSNLWFVEPGLLEELGPVIGRGAVWMEESVQPGVPSDAYLFSGYDYRGLHLSHSGDHEMVFVLEVDVAGDGKWRRLREVTLPPNGYVWTEFKNREKGAWIRVKPDRNGSNVTAFFNYRNKDDRSERLAAEFKGLASAKDGARSDGLLHARGNNTRTLRFLASDARGELGCYDLDGELNLRRAMDPDGAAWMKQNLAVPQNVLAVDSASVLYVDEKGRRWRLPKGADNVGRPGVERVSREVCTERDLFNAAGIFYELPAENAGGFSKIRAITTHNRWITDYASYRGLLVMAGITANASPSEHIIVSDDRKCAVWVGVVDDLWRCGKARGVGGPWKETRVEAGQRSDPYLMTGFDKKLVSLSHSAPHPVTFRLEVDLSGDGLWVPYREFNVPPGKNVKHRFADAFGAYWVRCSSDTTTTATAWFLYE